MAEGHLKGHADVHHPALGHHFETLEQQHETNVLGMWLFLVTEIMLFGGMFTAYIIFRILYPEVFFQSSHHQNVTIGAINT
ncbi:MAG: cytochrome c oxidase subunit 3 family protein, partial [Ardenticatenaceae bacterium]